MNIFCVFLLAAGLAWPPLAASAGDGVPIRTHSVAAVPSSPDGHWMVTPFVDADDAVVHLQRESAAGPGPGEVLLDARSGQPWAGDFSALLSSQFRRVRPISPDELAASRLATKPLLQALGCTRQHWACTLPDDHDVVLLLRWDSAASTLTFDTIDLRPLLETMSDVLAGQIDHASVRWSAVDWQLLELASRLPRWHERWLDAMRAITDPAALERVARSYGAAGLNLGQRPFLTTQAIRGSATDALAQSGQGADAGLDVRGELELAGQKMRVRQQGLLWLQQRREAQAQALAQSLMEGTGKIFQVRVAAHLVEVLLDLPGMEVAPLAAMLAQQARAYQSQDLLCFSRSVLQQSCLGAALASAPPPRLPGKAPLPPGPARPKPVSPPPAPRDDALDKSVAQNALQEVAMIKKLPDSATLMAFDEVSGRMSKEKASLSGLTFIARSLGTVQEGRFEVQVVPNPGAPMRLSQGTYRVKVRLVMDYTREDRCRGGWSCLLSKPFIHAKTEQRNAVFYINSGNRYINTQMASFGDLLPLSADGGQHYDSRLTAARLSVGNVALELN